MLEGLTFILLMKIIRPWLLNLDDKYSQDKATLVPSFVEEILEN